MPGNNLDGFEIDGFEIKAAISSETVSDEVWNHLVEYAAPLLETIRFTFTRYDAVFDVQDCLDVLHDTFIRVVLKSINTIPLNLSCPGLEASRVIER